MTWRCDEAGGVGGGEVVVGVVSGDGSRCGRCGVVGYQAMVDGGGDGRAAGGTGVGNCKSGGGTLRQGW